MITVDDLEPGELLEIRAGLQDRGGRATLEELVEDMGLPAEFAEFVEAGLLESVVEDGLPFAIPSAQHDAHGRQVWLRLDLAGPDDYAVGVERLRARAEEAMRTAERLHAAAGEAAR